MKQKILEALSFYVPLILVVAACGGTGAYITLAYWNGITPSQRVVLSLAFPVIMVGGTLITELVIPEKLREKFFWGFVVTGIAAYAVYYYMSIGESLGLLFLSVMGICAGIIVGGVAFSLLCALFRFVGESLGKKP